ncbi:MAG TPA: alanine racemase [Clostridia bacterium]|nr:alanine racemase [Clostridia bacterium]
MELAANCRTWAQIDLSALKFNLGFAKAGGSKVMCVIKANAYGHGAVECGRFLEKNGADAFAVASLSEAAELRDARITLPILILGYTPPEYIKLLLKYDVLQTAVDEEHAQALSDAALNLGARLKTHIKLDTGMSRLGLFAQGEEAAKEAAQAALRISSMRGLQVEGMFTHFAIADEECGSDYTAWQLNNYLTVIRILEKAGARPPVCHAANSACILGHPEVRFDMVREGIMLYGLYPTSVPQQGPLKPVMALKSRVVQIKEFPSGTTVSYGRTYEADKPVTCAVICAGYADGLPRRLSGRFEVNINGRFYKQIGRVCMDMCMADVTGSDVKRGDEVTLFGPPGISIERAATEVGTINYELTCLVTPRVKRMYING